jgi:predicted signal transduction protein with EAL and GGDEF domain
MSSSRRSSPTTRRRPHGTAGGSSGYSRVTSGGPRLTGRDQRHTGSPLARTANGLPRDRCLAAADRRLAREDRAQATADREANETDSLTGARRRGPGLADMQRNIDRARRSNGRLIAAYVDIDGLKTTNDRKGHRAGDTMLAHIVDVMAKNLRSYEPIVRLSGDRGLIASRRGRPARSRTPGGLSVTGAGPGC